MQQRGFALNAVPSLNEPGVYTIDTFIERYVDGALTTIEMRSRTAVEFDAEWMEEIPEMQFIFTLLEVASQIIGRSSGPDDIARFRSAIAQAMDSMEKLSLDDL